MKEFSVVMSLCDYIPVALFAAAAVILQRDLYNKMSKGAFALFAAGTIDIFCAGILKATYKLLYATGVCDFEALSVLFFPLQAIGFLLAGIAVAAMIFCKQFKPLSASAAVTAPGLYSGTPIFIVLMVTGLAAMNSGLCVIAAKMKRPSAIVFFIISLLCSLAMGYLSSKDFANGYMNWIAEGINTAGQLSFLLGAVILHRSGLSRYNDNTSA